jgi:spore germination protein
MKRVQHSLSRTRMVWIVLLCVMALLLLSAATSHAAPQSACGNYHYVQRGETLFSISMQYGVSIPAVMQANPAIGNPNRIYAGTYLYIPCGPGGPGVGGPCRQMHYVAWGQTLGEIALFYRVNPYAIAQANGIQNLDLIYAGEHLCIP